jgi:hypothetical protein
VAVFIDDAAFVRAPIELVYDRITHIGAWPSLWPGARVRSSDGDPDREWWSLELRGRWGRRVRLRVGAAAWRMHAGFAMELAGDLEGTWEIWLEPVAGGTVVHHVVLGTTPGRQRTVREDLRRALRLGSWGLKDALQLEARTMAGLRP